MDPQEWLGAFVQRNRMDLARLRGYLENAGAVVMPGERKRRPRPKPVEGVLVGMEIRDLVLISAKNPVFESGRFHMRRRQNLGILLGEKATGFEFSVRKVKHDGPLMRAAQNVVSGQRNVFVQDPLFSEDDAGPDLPQQWTMFMVWSVGPQDTVTGCHAIVADVPRHGKRKRADLNRATLLAVCDIPPIQALAQATSQARDSVVTSDDFGLSVQKRPQAGEDGAALGESPSGA